MKINFKQMKKANLGLKLAISLYGLIAIPLGAIALYHDQKCGPFNRYAEPLCQKVMEKFDENKNGWIDFQEGTNLARAVGYEDEIPISANEFSNSFLLSPDYNSFNKNLVNLSIAYTKKPGNHGWPIYKKFNVPIEKLEMLAEDCNQK